MNINEYFKSFPSIYVGKRRKYPFAGIIAGLIIVNLLFIWFGPWWAPSVAYFFVLGVFYLVWFLAKIF